MRAHSTRDKQLEEPAPEDAGLAGCLAVASGDVATRFRVRTCSGVGGADRDLRSAFREALRARSPASGCVGRGAAGAAVGFAASPKAFNEALMTWVARTAFSLAESPAVVAAFVDFLPGARPLAVVFGARPVLEARDSVPSVLAEDGVSLGKIRSLRSTAVAGEQVDIEVTADRTESA